MEVLRLKFDTEIQPTVFRSEELIIRHFKLILSSVSNTKTKFSPFFSFPKTLNYFFQTKEVRNITHFQYIAWPDHGIPASSGGFLNLMESSEKNNYTHGPLVVHCR